MSGAGNSFLIVNESSETNQQIEAVFGKQERSKIAKYMASSEFGPGADGVLFLKKGTEADIEWEFYNSDGSRPEMCGNASRCAARFAFDNKLAGKRVSLKTDAGIVFGEVEDRVTVRLTTPTQIQKKSIQIGEEMYQGLSVDTGVPHFVVWGEGKEEKLVEIGKEIRNQAAFFPRGTNVTFVWKNGDAKSYERGVEDITLACGTGAVAAGVFLTDQGEKNYEEIIDLNFPGGLLSVRIGKGYSFADLIGDATYLGEFEFGKEV